jgi:hypothetical protein
MADPEGLTPDQMESLVGLVRIYWYDKHGEVGPESVRKDMTAIYNWADLHGVDFLRQLKDDSDIELENSWMLPIFLNYLFVDQDGPREPSPSLTPTPTPVPNIEDAEKLGALLEAGSDLKDEGFEGSDEDKEWIRSTTRTINSFREAAFQIYRRFPDSALDRIIWDWAHGTITAQRLDGLITPEARKLRAIIRATNNDGVITGDIEAEDQFKLFVATNPEFFAGLDNAVILQAFKDVLSPIGLSAYRADAIARLAPQPGLDPDFFGAAAPTPPAQEYIEWLSRRPSEVEDWLAEAHGDANIARARILAQAKSEEAEALAFISGGGPPVTRLVAALGLPLVFASGLAIQEDEAYPDYTRRVLAQIKSMMPFIQPVEGAEAILGIEDFPEILTAPQVFQIFQAAGVIDEPESDMFRPPVGGPPLAGGQRVIDPSRLSVRRQDAEGKRQRAQDARVHRLINETLAGLEDQDAIDFLMDLPGIIALLERQFEVGSAERTAQQEEGQAAIQQATVSLTANIGAIQAEADAIQAEIDSLTEQGADPAAIGAAKRRLDVVNARLRLAEANQGFASKVQDVPTTATGTDFDEDAFGIDTDEILRKEAAARAKALNAAAAAFRATESRPEDFADFFETNFARVRQSAIDRRTPIPRPTANTVPQIQKVFS